MKTPVFSKLLSAASIATVLLSQVPMTLAASSFTDVNASTSYKAAIEAMKEKGVIEGYADGTFQAGNSINRGEFLKIVLEARGEWIPAGSNCFPDVKDEWFAKYVCTAEEEGIVSGYPNGLFRPEQRINFVEASKILSLAYRQKIELYSPDWYEPYARAMESSKAIPPSIDTLEHFMTRGEMVEMMWRLSEGKEDQPTKGYMNVKYPDMQINLALDTPQMAKSCVDLKAFTDEATRQTTFVNGVMQRDEITGAPSINKNADVPQMTQTGGGSDGGASFSDTNVQVEGVDEGDIVKTDGKYLYIVSAAMVRIVLAEGTGNPVEVSTIDLEEVGFTPSDLYIDGKRLVILGWRYVPGSEGPIRIMNEKRMIAPGIWPGYSMQKSEVRIYDISDARSPTLERKVAFEGDAISSRRIEDKLYLVVNQPVRWFGAGQPTVATEDLIVPLFEDSKDADVQMPVARCADIMILPHIPSPQYLTVAVIPLRDPNAEVKREVVLGSAENIYASLENLYVATTAYQYYWNAPDNDGPRQKTNLYRFNFTDSGISLEAQGSVVGRIHNQFSMDEHEGNFRIATTIDPTWLMEHGTEVPSTNSLYILNPKLNVIGKIEDMAPGEQIYSTRFMGDRAYIVTFRQVDPLFVIDTSDPRNPEILGKLKIPGVSDYLHPYDENHVIGFGREAVEAKEGDPSTGLGAGFAWFQGMKVSVFDVRDVANPKELHQLVIGDRGTSSPLFFDHKALLFEKDRGLVSFPVSVYEIPENQKVPGDDSVYGSQVFQGAYVYDFNLKDGFTLSGRITHYSEEDQLKAGDTWNAYGKDIERIVRVNESLFTISQEAVKKNALSNLSEQGMVEFK